MRIYVPYDYSRLDTPDVRPAEVFTLTPAILKLGESYRYDESDCEGLALDYAAMASCEFKINQQVGRRLVLAADVPANWLSKLDDSGLGSAVCAQTISWSQVVSLHTDATAENELLERACHDEAAWEQLSARFLQWYDISEKATLQQLASEVE